MANRFKAQGTAWETLLCRYLWDAGFDSARRLAEGGKYDPGDIEVRIGDALWLIEGRARERHSIHPAVAKASGKARRAGYPHSAVAWKRLVRVQGNSRRTPVAGQAVIVAMSLEDFLALAKDASNGREQEPPGDPG